MGRLTDKVAIVTGGARARARRSCAPSWPRAPASSSPTSPRSPAPRWPTSSATAAVLPHHDVSDEASWTALVEETNERCGPVNVLVNNAGILRFGEIEEMPLEEFELVWRVNQVGCFLGMKAVVPHHEASNGGGSIINASSVEGMGGMGSVSAYCGSKWAIRGMTKAAAMSWPPARASGSTRCTPA